MAKPTPDQVSAANLNSELNKTSGSQISFGASNTRNIAYVTTGQAVTGTLLSYGLDLPGNVYNSNNKAYLSAYRIGGTAIANLVMWSNGTGQYLMSGTGETSNKRFTWIQSGGTNSNYYANMNVIFQQGDGAANGIGAVSDVTNTDLPLSTTRSWRVVATAVSGTIRFNTVRANLILKFSTDGGATKEEYFRRLVEYYVEADNSGAGGP